MLTTLQITSQPNAPTPSAGAGAEAQTAGPVTEVGRVFCVFELAGQLRVKSVPISKESSKALFLGDSLLLPNSNQPKRLLIKGLDMIARNEREAVEQYIQYLKDKLNELEQTKKQTRLILSTAEALRANMV